MATETTPDVTPEVTAVVTAPARRPRRLVGLTAAVAGVAAAATAVVVLAGVGSEPAYAVSKGSDGGVSVRIHAFTDPDGLERDLAAAGVPAAVDYLPEGQTCKAPRGRHADAGGAFATGIRKDGDGIAFTIEKGQVPKGSTLVLTVSKSAQGDTAPPSATSLEIVEGQVAPCEPASLPLPPPGQGRSGGHQDEGPSTNSRPDPDDGPTLTTTHP
ncbi:hypothetical protein AB0K18_26545 [Nonomuraea sp. NPDC049421]|uniref:hypothetical protein n=1 Tax=Nonomuraea sp. NPDC049421 TaxID=3155275 RepID=UPI0034194D4B